MFLFFCIFSAPIASDIALLLLQIPHKTINAPNFLIKILHDIALVLIKSKNVSLSKPRVPMRKLGNNNEHSVASYRTSSNPILFLEQKKKRENKNNNANAYSSRTTSSKAVKGYTHSAVLLSLYCLSANKSSKPFKTHTRAVWRRSLATDSQNDARKWLGHNPTGCVATLLFRRLNKRSSMALRRDDYILFASMYTTRVGRWSFYVVYNIHYIPLYIYTRLAVCVYTLVVNINTREFWYEFHALLQRCVRRALKGSFRPPLLKSRILTAAVCESNF